MIRIKKTHYFHRKVSQIISGSASLTVVWCHSLDWIIEVWITIHSHNSLLPPPNAGHWLGHTLLWIGVPFFNQHLSLLRKHRIQTDPANVQCGCGQDCRSIDCQSTHSPPKFWRFLVNCALWGRALSFWRIEFGPGLWRCGIAWLHNLISISLSIETASSEEKPRHHHRTASTKISGWWRNQLSVLCVFTLPNNPTAVGRIWTHR